MLQKFFLVIFIVFPVVVSAFTGKFSIQNKGSLQCMGVYSSTATPPVTSLQQVQCVAKGGKKDPNQLWQLINGGGGNSNKVYIATSTLAQCLQAPASAGLLQLAPCQPGNPRQLFLLSTALQTSIGFSTQNTIYHIKSHGLCVSLNITTGSDTSKSFSTQECSNGLNQQFVVKKMGAQKRRTSSSSSSSSGDTSSSGTPLAVTGAKDQKISGVYLKWTSFDNNTCDDAAAGCDNIAFPKKDGWKVAHNAATEDLGTYAHPITLAAAADDNGAGGPWPVGTLIYVPMVHKYFVFEDSCLECSQDWKMQKYHVDLYMGPNVNGGTQIQHCILALSTTNGVIIVNPSEGYPVEPQKIYTEGNCTSKHNFPTNVTPSTSTSSSTSSSSSSSSSSSGTTTATPGTPVAPNKDGTITFAGRTWHVRSDTGGGPGPNDWDTQNAWVDTKGYLHLKIAHRNGKWSAAEIYQEDTQSMGFGTYQFQIIGRPDIMDDNVVLGLFNYTTPALGPDGTNEIDIEFATWGGQQSEHGNWTVYPFKKMKQTSTIYNTQLNSNQSTHRFIWSGSQIVFQSMYGFEPVGSTANMYKSWTFAPADAATAIPQKPLPVHLNLWLFNGQAPKDGKEVEMIISDFSFTPL